MNELASRGSSTSWVRRRCGLRSRGSGWLAAVRPYGFHIAVLVYLPLLLGADVRTEERWQQQLLGVLTALLLLVATRFSPVHERRFIWAAVCFWAGVEVLGSLVWGIYRYRFDNLPLYVPFGHGLIYLFGLRALRLPLSVAHALMLRNLAIVVAVGWALAGVTVLPLLTGRVDIAGATLLPFFVYGVARSKRATMYVAIFCASSTLEILGISLGNWQWVEFQPWTHLPQGNPPSVIAGAYCLWDAVIARVARLVRLHYRADVQVGVAGAE